MIYLLWLSLVKKYIAENYSEINSWDEKGGWRDAFHANKSPALAVTEIYGLVEVTTENAEDVMWG